VCRIKDQAILPGEVRDPMRTVSKGYLLSVLLLAVGCYGEVQHGLTEAEANEILVVLNGNGIDAKKAKEEGAQTGDATWKVQAKRSDLTRSWALLKDAELPRPRVQGLEVFNKGSLIPTPAEEKAMLLSALNGEITKALRGIEGVVDANVMVVIPEEDRFRDKDKPAPEPTASVHLKWRSAGGKGVPPFRVEEIQALVGHAVPNLKPGNVAVMVTAATPMQSGSESLAAGMTSVMGLRMSSEARLLLIVLAVALLTVTGFLVLTLMSRPAAPSE
jgi:type III secretion protein J